MAEVTMRQLLEAGVYVSIHNQVLRFPGVYKDKKSGTFMHTSDEGTGS